MAMQGKQAITEAPQHATFRLDQLNAAKLVAQRRAPLVIADTLTAPEWTPVRDEAPLRSWLGAPLIAKGQVLGILNISASSPNRFTARDAEVALAFASQAAVAMENARLYQESVTRVEQELEIASQIQRNLFPRTLPQVEGLDLAAWCLPARETGGDFYDLIALRDPADPQHAGPRRAPLLGLMIGDASGKSIPAAMLMAIARSIARSEARDHQTPQDVMRETNRWIAEDVPARSFVALAYATLDLHERRLALANAGQLAPLRRRSDGRVEYLEVPGATLPLGILPDTPYATLELQLEPGDLLLFYTDGIVEAQDHSHALYGFERLEQLLHRYGALPPDELIEQVIRSVEQFTGSAPQHDDMTMVALRIE
jgi:serine phosphatase RsbU (regulator of sigma subunit)